MPTAQVQKQILTLGEKKAKTEFGWRPMAMKVTQLFKLKEPLTHETVRRMHHELLAKQKQLKK